MLKCEKYLLFAIAFEICFLSSYLAGCGGHDPQCTSPGGCHDSGTDSDGTTPPQQDSGTDSDGTPPQKDSGPEAPVANCNDYAQYGQNWACYVPPDGVPFTCNFNMLTDNGNCLIHCPGEFSCILPPGFSTYQQFTCLTYDTQDQRTCMH